MPADATTKPTMPADAATKPTMPADATTRAHPRQMSRRRIATIYSGAILAGVLVALLLVLGLSPRTPSPDTRAADYAYWRQAINQSTARCVANYDQIKAIAQWLVSKPYQIDNDDKAVMATAWANCLSLFLPGIPASLREDHDVNTAQVYIMQSNMYAADAAFALKQISEGWQRPQAKEEAQTAIGKAVTDYHLYQDTIAKLSKVYAKAS